MISYIKSETYRMLHNKGNYLFILICSALLISSNVVLAVVDGTSKNFPYANTNFSLGMLYTSLSMVFLLCISVTSIAFGNEYGNHTMKNSISYGISRGHIYFGKLISSILYAFVAFIVICGLYLLTGYGLLEHSHGPEMEILLKAVLAALPLFLYAVAVTNCFSFLLEGSGSAITAIVSTMLAFPYVCNLLGMKFQFFQMLAKILPWNLINNMDFNSSDLILPWEGATGYYYYWIAGVVQMLLFVILGYVVFRRKEIK
ncbi:ABC-type transport system involved in multi-copper enzyme maturation permease subunit [Anaerotaenia torta]|uniref:ABC transporter permease subunit n=1 Tax=Anaerotaenia torta TaxID=433293 RepID=UPI003D262529